MSRTTLYRLTGGALVASFVVSLAGGLAHPVVDGQAHSVASMLAPRSPWAQMLIYLGALLLMVGLPGAIAWLAPNARRLAVVGLGVYFLGNALSAQSHLVVEGFVAPAIARDPDARHLVPADGSIVAAVPFQVLQVAGGLVLVLGLLLSGIGLLRSRVLPRWVGIAFVVGAVLAVTPLPEAAVLSGLQIELARGLAVAGIGLAMVRSTRTVGVVDVTARPAVTA